MKTATNWNDYELIDSGDGEKLERWGSSPKECFVLARPDPMAIWPKGLSQNEWAKSDAHYIRSEKGGGSWKTKKQLPEKWGVEYNHLLFLIKPTSFKHTGLFPEQSVNWDIFSKIIKDSNDGEINILNLFAYTGGATIACAKAGAKVCHVDSSKGIVSWAKDNAKVNNITEKIRWIVDDAIKFVERELKRGMKYDGIIMDPPSFGRGSKGEVWKLEKDLFPLVKKTVKLLSDKPKFFHINSYTTGMSPTTIGNILESSLGKINGNIEVDEIGIKESNSKRILPQGVFGRWTK